MNGLRSFRKQRNQRCKNKVNVQDFRLRKKGAFKNQNEKNDVLDSILSRLSHIEKKLGLELKNEG